MPVSLTYSQRTTYIGDTAIFNGATFIWNGTEYIETGLIQIDNPLLNNRKVVIQFNAKLIQTSRSSTTTLSAGFLDVYVDNVQWDEEQIYRTDAYLEVTFDESFLRTQKIVTFQSKQGESRTRFAVRSNVYTDSDVVVVKYDVIDSQKRAIITLSNVTFLKNGFEFSAVLFAYQIIESEVNNFIFQDMIQ